MTAEELVWRLSYQMSFENFSKPVQLPKLYSKQDLCRIFGCCSTTVDLWARENRIPKPIAYVGKRPYWNADILEHLKKPEAATV